MSAEYDGLPTHVRTEVDRFTDTNTQWLFRVLSARHPEAAKHDLEARALAIFAAVEGAQLVARGRKNIHWFDKVIDSYSASGLFD